MAKTILLIGAFDTKGEEYRFLRDRILERGHRVIAVDTGVRPASPLFPIDVDAAAVAAAGGRSLAELRSGGNRADAIRVMSAGAAAVAARLHKENRIDGAIGMGGSGGTTIVAAALRALPIGFPKVCMSTLAFTSIISDWVGTSDIVVMPSVVDVAGINRVSRVLLTRAAGAVCGMAEAEPPAAAGERPVVALTMFGNTTPCVDRCRERLEKQAFDVLVFHATGAGGRTMEGLVREGWVNAVLDITTTEWADEICGGLQSAGPERLDAPGWAGLPHVIVPGCIDMVNFAGCATVPARYAGRVFYEWGPSVTLMRTNAEENRRMGEIFAEKANAARGPVAFLVPTRGYSILDSVDPVKGPQPFWDPEADRAFVDGLRSRIASRIRIVEMETAINDVSFADRATDLLLELLSAAKRPAPPAR